MQGMRMTESGRVMKEHIRQARVVFILEDGWTLNGRPIRMPFPPQSAASGWSGPVPEVLEYACVFRLPEGFPRTGRKALLCFGAVDQTASVRLNGRVLGSHEGGYLPFSFDAAEALREGENLLEVRAEDRLSHDYPYGKQTRKPHGMWYTPVSGIWQPVYLESVPEKRITGVRIDPDLTGITLTVETEGSCAAEIRAGEEPVLRAEVPGGKPIRLEIPAPHLWSPEDPFLYQLRLETEQDTVTRSFGLRTVSIRRDGMDVPRLCLNGKPIFLSAVLDQGYYPKGLFRPAAGDPGYEEDIRKIKALGFNAVRMHIKVEQPAFYEACDRLGLLVLQDMVQNGHYSFLFDTVLPTIGFKYRPDLPFGSRRRRAFFEAHCRGIIGHLRSHPSVILYTLFNEGWGQYDSDRLYREMKTLDPSRVYVTASGWFKGHMSDMDSEHVYFRNKRLRPRSARPLLLSECGGYTRMTGSLTKNGQKVYGYGKADTEQQLTDKIRRLYEIMVLPAIPEGLCGVVYTQLYDVEGEINGLYTYDRHVLKTDADTLLSLNVRCAEALRG